MKFGRRLEAEQEEAYRPYYIRYNALKALLKAAPDAASAPRNDALHIRAAINRRLTPTQNDIQSAMPATGGYAAAQFMEMLEADLERANKFVTLQVEDLKLRSRALGARAAAAATAAELDRIEAAADDVAAAAVRLDRFILLNYAGAVKIMKKHDRVTGLATRPWLLSRLSRDSFLQVRFDRVVTALSDAYAAVRARRDGGAPADGGATWVPPESFERSTTKFWVAPEDVLAVKCALVKHLPVLIFGRASGVPLPLDGGGSRDVPSDSSLITSVYLDSAALDVYRTRLEREEGATLIRVRWYGDVAGDVAGDAELFVERKTHHESWTTDGSVKERFRLRGRHVAALLAGRLDVEAQLAKLAAGGASEADVARTRALATEVAAEVAARRLAPALRTVYYRTAFQAATSNAVRVSLDTQLRMLDERDAATSPPAAAGGDWCRPPHAPPLPPHQQVEFPFAVLEIKLQDAPPPWVEELLASGRLVQCTKFSKFLHGTAALRPGEVPKLPHWWDDAAVAGDAAVSSAVAVATTVARAEVAPLPAVAKRELSQCSMGVAEHGSADDLTALRPAATPPTSRRLLPRSLSAPQPAPQPLHTVTVAMSPVAAADAHREPKPPPPTPPPPPSGIAAIKARLLSARGGGGGGGGNSGIVPAGAAAAGGGALLTAAAKRHVPIKIEPKTFFANERTMLQWLNMATLILFTSLALTSYNDPLSRNKVLDDGRLDYSSQIAGAVLAPVAVVFIVYALWTYLWRARRIARREASARYDDRYGPAVLVLLLLVVTITSIVLSIAHADWHKPQRVTPVLTTVAAGAPAAAHAAPALSMLRATAAVLHLGAPAVAAAGAPLLPSAACGQLPVTWPPYFRPRGAAFVRAGDGGEATLLLGGTYTLAQLALRNTSDVTLLPAPGYDVAALAGGPAGELLLGAARPANVLASYDISKHAITHATDLTARGLLTAAAGISAMASGPDGTLLLTGDGGIEVLELEPPSGPVGALTWRAVRFLPLESLGSGIWDRHVSGLAYDGRTDALYLLFDRARPAVLRAVCLRTGALLGDWELPAALGGGAQQPSDAAAVTWSGVAVAPDGGAAYVTRAAPPQLWRFARAPDGRLACDAAP